MEIGDEQTQEEGRASPRRRLAELVSQEVNRPSYNFVMKVV